VEKKACTDYTPVVDDSTNATQKLNYCNAILDSNEKKCTFVNGDKCTDRTCGNAPTPTTDSDCSNHKTDCTISKESTYKCIENTTGCTGFYGLPADCQSFKSNKCWS
jgi:hypothetical protein